MSMGCSLLNQLTHRTRDEGDAHVVELDITDEIRGPSGAVHGGIIASLVDRAGAYVVWREGARPVATSNVALSYLAAGTIGPLEATARPLRIGLRQGVVEVQVCDAGNGGRLIATGMLTLSYMTAPGDG